VIVCGGKYKFLQNSDLLSPTIDATPRGSTLQHAHGANARYLFHDAESSFNHMILRGKITPASRKNT
jgi:hypothetical protein